MTESAAGPLKATPLADLHRRLGAKMVPFAGYELPLQFKDGIVAEHLHTRQAASLFDVSHMGQILVRGPDLEDALEKLIPCDIKAMGTGMMRYTMLLNDRGGIIDDLILVRRGHHVSMIANASRKAVVCVHMRERLGPSFEVTELADRALLALQGPAAAEVLSRIAPAARHLVFMNTEKLTLWDSRCFIARSGYTGEDGYEFVVRAEEAEHVAELLLDEPEVKPAGLGARDTLRLEAGYCLSGTDIDENTTPVEAGLAWTIGRRRREEGGFIGADVVLRQMREGPKRRRVGIKLDGKAPARSGAPIVTPDGKAIGAVTSGGFGPSVGAAIAMGYVDAARAQAGTAVHLIVRDKPLSGRIIDLPFVPNRNRPL